MPAIELPSWHSEIVELHDFFQAWLRGELPPTEAAFARLPLASDPAFTLVTPDGTLITYQALLADLRKAHNTRPNWRMWIKNPRLIARSGDLTIASYEEWHQLGATTTGRISTAVFRDQADAPNGLTWLHVHETWLPRQEAQ